MDGSFDNMPLSLFFTMILMGGEWCRVDLETPFGELVGVCLAIIGVTLAETFVGSFFEAFADLEKESLVEEEEEGGEEDADKGTDTEVIVEVATKAEDANNEPAPEEQPEETDGAAPEDQPEEEMPPSDGAAPEDQPEEEMPPPVVPPPGKVAPPSPPPVENPKPKGRHFKKVKISCPEIDGDEILDMGTCNADGGHESWATKLVLKKKGDEDYDGEVDAHDTFGIFSTSDGTQGDENPNQRLDIGVNHASADAGHDSWATIFDIENENGGHLRYNQVVKFTSTENGKVLDIGGSCCDAGHWSWATNFNLSKAD